MIAGNHSGCRNRGCSTGDSAVGDQPLDTHEVRNGAIQR